MIFRYHHKHKLVILLGDCSVQMITVLVGRECKQELLDKNSAEKVTWFCLKSKGCTVISRAQKKLCRFVMFLFLQLHDAQDFEALISGTIVVKLKYFFLLGPPVKAYFLE